MLNYIKAEFYRIFHKKNLYIYFIALLAVYGLTIFIRLSTFDHSSIADEALTVFNFFPVFIGGYIFTSVYNDDLNAGTLASVIGFGRSKFFIILSKLGITIILTTGFYFCALIALESLFYLTGAAMGIDTIVLFLKMVLNPLLLTIGYVSIAGIFVYGIQKATFSIVAYVLLSLGIISTILEKLLKHDAIQSIFGDLSKYMLTNIVSRFSSYIMGVDSNGWTILQYCIYLLIVLAISTVVFHKKELEF
jgi:ABC-2 type transport system permease protein